MEDRPQDRPEDRRRRGPLGDEEDAEETRRVPQEARGEEEATRQVSPEYVDEQREATTRAEPTPEQQASRRLSDEEEPETRVIRTSGAAPGASAETTAPQYPSGDYLEADERREAHLREVYGGVDWLASFIGCVFAVLCGAVLLSLSGLVLGPLGFTLNLEERGIDAFIIMGLVVVGVLLFLSCLFGGYVAGRLARFDGGRNGAAMVLWGILLSVLLLFFGSLLPGTFFELLQDFVNDSLLPAIRSLIDFGLAGAGIIVGALLVALLGGFTGGRLGNRYHTHIDYTS